MYMCAYMFVCVYVDMSISAYACLHICMYDICVLHMCMDACMYICICELMNSCIYVYLYTCIELARQT